MNSLSEIERERFVSIFGFAPHEISSLHNRRVLTEHAEEAAFLWTLRELATSHPLYRLPQLAMLDTRVLAHLEALRLAGPHGVSEARRLLGNADSGAMFVTTSTAIAAEDAEVLRGVFQIATTDDALAAGVTAGLSWCEAITDEPVFRTLDAAGAHMYRRIAFTVAAEQRKNVGESLARAVVSEDPNLRARALQSIGEMKRADLADAARDAMRDAYPHCRFWAAWSLAILGSPEAAKTAFDAAFTDESLTTEAIQIAMRAGEQNWAREAIRSLASESSTMRHAVIAAGAFGDPALMPWLLSLLENPLLARVAAEAFTMITGADPDEAELKTDPPEAITQEHADDSSLRWPAPSGFADWWDTKRARFVAGERYLVGSLIGDAAALQVLRNGYQRQRHGAAIEFARLRPDAIVFPIRARADWQQRRLTR